jgi:transcriptional regulator with XRE-family HTH domain
MARKYAELTQEELALQVGASQGLISKIELGNQEEGTSLVVKIAVACGVSAVWLDTGKGDMLDHGLHIEDMRIKKALVLMQEMPSYAVDEAVKSLDSIAKLTTHRPPEDKAG